MRVLMLGWEFPPFITGGLGTACYGLTRALDQHGVHVSFVLPQAVAGDHAAHVDLVSPQEHQPEHTGPELPVDEPSIIRGRRPVPSAGTGRPDVHKRPGFAHAEFVPIESEFAHPYPPSPGTRAVGEWVFDEKTGTHRRLIRRMGEAGELIEEYEETDADPGITPVPAPVAHEYGGELIHQVERYASFCLNAARYLDFDIIHAHDWMTYPAGLWIARASGKPLVVHVHSTEFDRSGEHVNQQVYDIERRGMHGAMKVICVSQLTKNSVMHRYAVPEEMAEVVYNGVQIDTAEAGITGIKRRDKIVLYFGRITFQKGPEYFLRAAKRVLEHSDDIIFVVAGSGDMAQHMIEMAAHMGIGHKVLFTGFLRGDDIKKVFAMADLYVMPSISEPFGIAPLEAMSNDVPVIISKSSGVSEVLSHALKVDFWDVDDMANKIIAVLRHPPLSQTLREHGRMEVRNLTWDGAAQRCESIYEDVLAGMARFAAPAEASV